MIGAKLKIALLYDLWNEDPTCLAELVEELNAQRLVARLFLELPQDAAASACRNRWTDCNRLGSDAALDFAQ